MSKGGDVEMVSRAAMNREEKRWREEEDARTLAEANVIREDPGRMRGAARAAERIAKEERARAEAMTKVAGKKTESSGSESNGKKRVKRSTQQPNKRRTTSFNVFERI
jgi:hypothetical protein